MVVAEVAFADQLPVTYAVSSSRPDVAPHARSRPYTYLVHVHAHMASAVRDKKCPRRSMCTGAAASTPSQLPHSDQWVGTAGLKLRMHMELSLIHI